MEPELAAFLRQRALESKSVDLDMAGKGTNTANRAIKPEGTRPCPICGKLMHSETEFTIAIDVCDEHGVWLDYGELEALAELRTQITRDVLKRHLESNPRRKDTAWSLLLIDTLLGARRNEHF